MALDKKILRTMNIITLIIVMIPIIFFVYNALIINKFSLMIDSPEICKLTTSSGWEQDCYRNLRFKTKDVETCNKLNDKSICYRSVAGNLNQSSICGLIDEEDPQRRHCYWDLKEMGNIIE